MGHELMPNAPHNLQDQIKNLETLLKQRRQEQLAQDQSDTDFALGVDNAWGGQHARLLKEANEPAAD